ncbi:hypothetical protein A0256_05000 [Mucilaginibacter sp. PAMC 26640]|nr:hypothetical protein A0256_05000 [Mucilaginibacter sp. PAMC 26640]
MKPLPAIINLLRSAALHLSLIITVLILSESCKKPGDPLKLPSPAPADTIGTENFEKLTAWKVYKTNHSTPYNLAVFGDSYVQGNYFTSLLRNKLLNDGNEDGGPGYCSFGRYDPTGLYSIDSSIDPEQLTFTYDPLKWTLNKERTVGPCGDVISAVANATINVTATVPLDAVTIIFEQHPDAGDFRYRLNGGAWVTVSISADVQSTNTYTIETDKLGDKIAIEIESLSVGQRFCGVVGQRWGSFLTVDKAGMSGGVSVFFGQDYPWESAVEALAPNGAVIMFGTNEQLLNLDPESLTLNVQFMIDHLRHYNPACDIMLISPPETKYATEENHKYKLSQYADAMHKLALANNTAFIDFEKIFPKFTQSSVDQGLMNADRVHPGPKGGELIAQTIFTAFKK